MTTKNLPGPFCWVGAKNRMRSKIAPILEEARRGRPVYVEPFGGTAAMLLALEPVNREVYNDADGRLADFFRALAEPETLDATDGASTTKILKFPRRSSAPRRRRLRATLRFDSSGSFCFLSLSARRDFFGKQFDEPSPRKRRRSTVRRGAACAFLLSRWIRLRQTAFFRS